METLSTCTAHVLNRSAETFFRVLFGLPKSMKADLRLPIGSSPRRQREFEGGAAGRVRVRPQSPAMSIDDGAANGKSDSHAAVLGGVERLEDPLAMIGRDPRPGIAYRDQHARGARFGGDQQPSLFLLDAIHRLDRVENEIQRHLLQLDS